MSAAKKDTGVVSIHGKEYLTVARRINDFREKHPDYQISSEVLSAAELVQVKATIADPEGRVIATGLAEELRGSTNINKTSALENAETSAVGRALAFYGMGGTEIASADEVANAITQQGEYDAVEKLKAHNKAVRDHLDSVAAIKGFLAHDSYSAAYECLYEIQQDDEEGYKALFLAPTKGGIFTTEERGKMKSDAMNAAKNDYHGGAA